MLQPHVIDIDGAFVGAAIRLDCGYRFIATDMRLEELDGTIWPTLAMFSAWQAASSATAASVAPAPPSQRASRAPCAPADTHLTSVSEQAGA